ncbi:hypothetical protein EZS27_015472, partial [termite gut metagenome]
LRGSHDWVENKDGVYLILRIANFREGLMYEKRSV